MGDVGNLVRAIAARTAEDPTSSAVWGKVGPEWRRLSWAVYGSSIHQAAKGLIRLGLAQGEVVPVLAAPRPDWSVGQGGILAAGGVIAPLSSDVSDAELGARLASLAPRIVLCDDVKRLARVRAVADERRLGIRSFVVLDGVTAHDPRMVTLDDLMIDGASVRDQGVDARVAAIGPDDVALLSIPARGLPVPVSHRELVERARQLAERVASRGPEAAVRALAQGPIDTLAQQILGWALPALTGWETWFSPDEDAFAATLPEARPAVALGTVRCWEGVADVVRERLAREATVRSGLAQWAARGTERHAAEGSDGLARRVARRLVLDPLRRALGLDALVLAMSTGPLPDPDDLASVGVVVEAQPSA